jgi:hypothetical protein
MERIDWWEPLDSDTKAWLIAHNGEPLPPEIVAHIAIAGGEVLSGPWIDETEDDGFQLSDAAVDWIEAVANGEVV